MQLIAISYMLKTYLQHREFAIAPVLIFYLTAAGILKNPYIFQYLPSGG